MNVSEQYLVVKMVEHLNVVNQYARLLHQGTYDEIFTAADGRSLIVELDEARENMVKALEKAERGLVSVPYDPMISVEELGQILNTKDG